MDRSQHVYISGFKSISLYEKWLTGHNPQEVCHKSLKIWAQIYFLQLRRRINLRIPW